MPDTIIPPNLIRKIGAGNPRGVTKGEKRGPYKKRDPNAPPPPPKPVQVTRNTGGTRRGDVLALTRDVKQEIINGLVEFGRDGQGLEGLKGFVKRVASENIVAACGLLRCVLPTEQKLSVIAEVNVPYQTLEEAVREAIEAGIPEKQILELQDYYQLPPPEREVEEMAVQHGRDTDE